MGNNLGVAQPAVGTDLAFGQGSRRLESSFALVVYWAYVGTAGQAAQPQGVGQKPRQLVVFEGYSGHELKDD